MHCDNGTRKVIVRGAVQRMSESRLQRVRGGRIVKSNFVYYTKIRKIGEASDDIAAAETYYRKG